MPERIVVAAASCGGTVESCASQRTTLSRVAKKTMQANAKTSPIARKCSGRIALGDQREPAGDDQHRTDDERRAAAARPGR